MADLIPRRYDLRSHPFITTSVAGSLALAHNKSPYARRGSVSEVSGSISDQSAITNSAILWVSCNCVFLDIAGVWRGWVPFQLFSNTQSPTPCPLFSWIDSIKLFDQNHIKRALAPLRTITSDARSLALTINGGMTTKPLRFLQYRIRPTSLTKSDRLVTLFSLNGNG
jgi:hypothetical protein